MHIEYLIRTILYSILVKIEFTYKASQPFRTYNKMILFYSQNCWRVESTLTIPQRRSFLSTPNSQPQPQVLIHYLPPSICLCWHFIINEILQYMNSEDWPLWLRMLILIKVHSCCQYSIPLYGWIMLHYIGVPHFSSFYQMSIWSHSETVSHILFILNK